MKKNRLPESGDIYQEREARGNITGRRGRRRRIVIVGMGPHPGRVIYHLDRKNRHRWRDIELWELEERFDLVEPAEVRREAKKKHHQENR